MLVRIARNLILPSLLTIAVMLTTLVASNALSARADGEPERVAIGSDLIIKAGETVKGDVSVTGGDLTVNGTVEGDAIVFNGSATITGKVGGDVVVTGGSVALRPGSEVVGNVVYVGGGLDVASGATVRGVTSTLDLPMAQLGNALPLSPAGATTTSTGARGPLDRLGSLALWGVVSMGVLALSVALLLAFPRRVRVTGATLEAEGRHSVILGLITACLFGPLVALVTSLLMVSVVGWVLIPVLWAIAGALLAFGLVAASLWLGRRVYDTTHAGIVYTGSGRTGQTGVLEKVPPLVFQMLLGITVLLLSVVVPAALMPGWVGLALLLIVYVAACTGLGAALLSRFGALMPPGGLSRHRLPVEHYGAGVTSPLGQLPGKQPK